MIRVWNTRGYSVSFREYPQDIRGYSSPDIPRTFRARITRGNIVWIPRMIHGMYTEYPRTFRLCSVT